MKRVYLAGPIHGCSDEEVFDWRKAAKDALRGVAECVDPADADFRGKESGNAAHIVKSDKALIDSSHVVLAMVTKPSVGTIMEIMHAHQKGKRVVVVNAAQSGSPWLAFHATDLVGTLDEAIAVVARRCQVVRIAKQFTFDAAHWLPNVAKGHKCGHMHGHTYRVDVICEGTPRADGMLEDYERLARAWVHVNTQLDHKVLNEVVGLENPTTENLAPWIMHQLGSLVPHMVGIRVYESSTTYCEVFNNG